MSKADEECWRCFKNNLGFGEFPRIPRDSNFLFLNSDIKHLFKNLETLSQPQWGSDSKLEDWESFGGQATGGRSVDVSLVHITPGEISALSTLFVFGLVGGTELGIGKHLRSSPVTSNWWSTHDGQPFTPCLLTHDPHVPHCSQPCGGQGSSSPWGK